MMTVLTLCFTATIFVALNVSAETDICLLPKDVGPCDEVCQAYFFNTDTGLCEQFEFGCCPGNANNFKTEAECLKTCRSTICSLPKKPGLCKAYFPRYFYNKKTGKCEQFIYGGCQANANNFKTEKECKLFCKRKISVRCRG